MPIPWSALSHQQSGLEPNRSGGLLDGLNQSGSKGLSAAFAGSSPRGKSFGDNNFWNSMDFLGC